MSTPTTTALPAGVHIDMEDHRAVLTLARDLSDEAFDQALSCIPREACLVGVEYAGDEVWTFSW